MEIVLGAEALRTAFGITGLDIPMIGFTDEEVKNAQGLGQFLVYRTDTAGDGKSLTMDKIVGILHNRLGDGNLIFPTEWYARELFYTRKTPKKGWRFVGGDTIPGPTGTSYIQQTGALVDYLVTRVYAGQELPAVYQAAVNEYEAKVGAISELADKNWKEYARQCMALKINQLFRDEPVDVLYDIVVQFIVNGVELFRGKRVCTAGFTSAGYPVVVPGRSGNDGIILSRTMDSWPSIRDSVCFSRGPVPTA